MSADSEKFDNVSVLNHKAQVDGYNFVMEGNNEKKPKYLTTIGIRA